MTNCESQKPGRSFSKSYGFPSGMVGAREVGREQCPGRIGIIGQNFSVPKFNWLHVVIFRVFFINLRYMFIHSSTRFGDFSAVLNFNQLFFKLSQFICN